jgi:hypothetical protein
MPARSRERDERLDRRTHGDDLGLLGPSAAHRHHNDLSVAREQPGQVPGDGGLAHALPGSHDCERRKLERLALGRVEPEVGPHVADAHCEHAARQREPLDRAEHGLVGQVDDDVGRKRLDRALDVVDHGDAVLDVAAELLRPANEHRGGELVGQLPEAPRVTGGVLAVDDHDRPQLRDVTSFSVAPVNSRARRMSAKGTGRLLVERVAPPDVAFGSISMSYNRASYGAQARTTRFPC